MGCSFLQLCRMYAQATWEFAGQRGCESPLSNFIMDSVRKHAQFRNLAAKCVTYVGRLLCKNKNRKGLQKF